MSRNRNAGPAIRAIVVACLAMLAGACAPPFERPAPYDDTALRTRAQTMSENGIRVSAMVPDREENAAIFGLDPYEDDIEPVWIEVENDTDRRLWFMPTGVDSEYFAPLEAAFGFHKRFSGNTHAVLDDHFDNLDFRNPIAPRSTSRGFVFTNTDKHSKVLNVDLISRLWHKSFTLIVPIPGNEVAAATLTRLSTQQPDAEFVDDESRLRTLLEQLPCCTSSEDGAPGEPLNLVLIGRLDVWVPALQRRHFRSRDVGPRYVFDRVQDLAGSKLGRWVPVQPHQIRLWRTKIQYQGEPVWIGQVSTPFGGRFASETSGDTQTRIEPEVDDARDDIVQELLYSQSVVKVGYVTGAGRDPGAEPDATSAGSIYHTDGLRTVLLFGQDSVPLSRIQFFEWERLIDHVSKRRGTSE